jgi:hypothetical protein
MQFVAPGAPVFFWTDKVAQSKPSSPAMSLARHSIPVLLTALTCLCSPALAADHESDDSGFGLHASETANVSQIGLPFYPGSTRRHDKDGDSPAANFGMWGGSFGIKLVVIKYRSDDPLSQVADFYRTAMARYGTVLDCSTASVTVKSTGDDPVTCDDDDAKQGQITLKVGKESDQRIVSLKKSHGETQFEMIRLRIKGD